MMFWILVALLTLLSLLSIGYPLLLKKRSSVDGSSFDKSVYREQLVEIDQDVERGQIDAGEAVLARAEIARRLIALDQPANGNPAPVKSSTATMVTAICALVLVPVLAGATYMALGDPNRPDMPLQARMKADPSKQSIDELIARAEARVQNSPDDARGWLVLAPVYIRLGRPKDAVVAYQNIIRLVGSKPEYEAALGEAITIAANGMITAEARKHFETAAKADPGDVKSEFFLAAALGQDGKHKESIAAWQVLLAKSPSDAPWVAPAQKEMQRMQKLAGISSMPKSGDSQPGSPTKDQIAAVSDMSTRDRNAMVENMVSRLAEKLAQDPSNLKGWLRIIRSYAVLGRKDDATAAWAKAGKVFADDPAATSQLAELAKAMKIEVKTQ